MIACSTLLGSGLLVYVLILYGTLQGSADETICLTEQPHVVPLARYRHFAFWIDPKTNKILWSINPPLGPNGDWLTYEDFRIMRDPNFVPNMNHRFQEAQQLAALGKHPLQARAPSPLFRGEKGAFGRIRFGHDSNASLEFEFDRGSPRIRTRPQFLNMADWEDFSKKQFFDRIVGVLQQTADPKQGIRLDDDLNEIPLKSSERVCRQHNEC